MTPKFKTWTNAGWQWDPEYVAALQRVYAPHLSPKQCELLGTIAASGTHGYRIRRDQFADAQALIDGGYVDCVMQSYTHTITLAGRMLFELITPNEESPIQLPGTQWYAEEGD